MKQLAGVAFKRTLRLMAQNIALDSLFSQKSFHSFCNKNILVTNPCCLKHSAALHPRIHYDPQSHTFALRLATFSSLELSKSSER